MNLMNSVRNCVSVLGGKTRGKTAPKARLNVEQLDERLLPAVTFGVYGDGTWAYNTDNDSWRKITPHKATVIDEGNDGYLFGTYADGTWRYNYWSNSWNKLTSAKASVLSAANDNTMFGSYNSGTWEWDGSWHKLSPAAATKIAAGENNHMYGTYGSGTWEWDSGWKKIGGGQAHVMDAIGDYLYASYDSGTLRYNSVLDSWSVHTTAIADDIAMGSYAAPFFSFDSGTWYHQFSAFGDGTVIVDTFHQITPAKADEMSNDQDSFVGSYSDGTWEYDNGWKKISNAKALLLA